MASGNPDRVEESGSSPSVVSRIKVEKLDVSTSAHLASSCDAPASVVLGNPVKVEMTDVSPSIETNDRVVQSGDVSDSVAVLSSVKVEGSEVSTSVQVDHHWDASDGVVDGVRIKAEMPDFSEWDSINSSWATHDLPDLPNAKRTQTCQPSADVATQVALVRCLSKQTQTDGRRPCFSSTEVQTTWTSSGKALAHTFPLCLPRSWCVSLCYGRGGQRLLH